MGKINFGNFLPQVISSLFAQSQHKKLNAISGTSTCLIGQGTPKNR